MVQGQVSVFLVGFFVSYDVVYFFFFFKLFCAVVFSSLGIIFNSKTGLTAVAFLFHLFL